MTLTLKYRPKTFSDVVGQKHVVPVLRAFVLNGEPPPVLVFAGQAGTGKTSLARIYAAALNCERSEGGDACGECSSCVSVQENSSESVVEIDAASNGGVSDVQNIRNMCMYAHFAKWRVIIIDEAQALSRDAFHALLKIFEEPPPRTVFMLLTTEPEKVLGTVKSRAIGFEFRTIPKVDVAKRISFISKKEGVSLNPLLIARIAQTTGGHLRDALMELDKCVQVGITEDEQYREFIGAVDVSLPILASAAYGDLTKALGFVDDYFSASSDLKRFIDSLSDAVIAVSKAHVGIPSSAGVAELARTVTRDAIMRALSVLWESYERLRVSHNPKVVAQMAVTKLVTELATFPVQQAEVVEKPVEKAIIEDEAEMSIEEALALLE